MTNYHDPSDKSKQEIYKVYTTPNPDGSVNIENCNTYSQGEDGKTYITGDITNKDHD